MSGHVRAAQRLEAGAVAITALVSAVVLYPQWWWVVLAAFLAFDLSMVGYAASPEVGAVTYNAIHNYGFPAVAALAAVALGTRSDTTATAVGVLACSWAFHVGVDRSLGYGLKFSDSFENTHLGRIGTPRRQP